jgi:F-type H+-transporting ATPase subunit b
MDAEFFVLCAFVVFVFGLGYMGIHKTLLAGLDKRGQVVADELAQAASLRQEAQALLKSFDAKKADADRQAAEIVADARAQAEQIGREAAVRLEEFVTRRTAQAEAKIAFAEQQAAAEVRAAAADHAARAAEILLRQETQGATGSELVTREIAGLKGRLN